MFILLYQLIFKFNFLKSNFFLKILKKYCLSNFFLDNNSKLSFIYLIIWCLLSVSSIFVVIIRDFVLRIYGIRASKEIHNKALRRVLYTPSWFFDTTPIGRILSRFSKDLEVVDTILLDLIQNFFNMVFLVIGMLGTVILTTNGLFIIPLVPVIAIYYIIFALYRKTQREIKRIEFFFLNIFFENLII